MPTLLNAMTMDETVITPATTRSNSSRKRPRSSGNCTIRTVLVRNSNNNNNKNNNGTLQPQQQHHQRMCLCSSSDVPPTIIITETNVIQHNNRWDHDYYYSTNLTTRTRTTISKSRSRRKEERMIVITTQQGSGSSIFFQTTTRCFIIINVITTASVRLVVGNNSSSSSSIHWIGIIRRLFLLSLLLLILASMEDRTTTTSKARFCCSSFRIGVIPSSPSLSRRPSLLFFVSNNHPMYYRFQKLTTSIITNNNEVKKHSRILSNVSTIRSLSQRFNSISSTNNNNNNNNNENLTKDTTKQRQQTKNNNNNNQRSNHNKNDENTTTKTINKSKAAAVKATTTVAFGTTSTTSKTWNRKVNPILDNRRTNKSNDDDYNNNWLEGGGGGEGRRRRSQRKYNTTTMSLVSSSSSQKILQVVPTMTIFSLLSNKSDDEIIEWIQSIIRSPTKTVPTVTETLSIVTKTETTTTTITTEAMQTAGSDSFNIMIHDENSNYIESSSSSSSNNSSLNNSKLILEQQQQQSKQFWTTILQVCYRCTRPDIAWDVFEFMSQQQPSQFVVVVESNNNNKDTNNKTDTKTDDKLVVYEPTRHHALIYVQTLLKKLMNTSNTRTTTTAADVSNLARAMDFVRYMAISNSVSIEEEEELIRSNYNNYYTTPQRNRNVLPDRILTQSIEMKQKLKERFGTVPSVPSPDSSFIKLLLRYCVTTSSTATTSSSNEIFELARQFICDFQSGIVGIEYQGYITEQSYHLLLDSNTCRSQPELAKDIIRDMRVTRRYRHNVIPPSHKTYTKAISLCRQSRNLDLALFYLSNAQLTDGLIPDVYMYSAAIWTAAQVRNADAALQLLQDMQQQHNCTPNIITYNGVLAALSSCGRIDEVIYTIYIPYIANNPHITPTYTTFFHLAAAIRNREDTPYEEKLANLWRIYERMGRSERRVTVGGPILEELITSYGALGHYEEAKIIFDSITGPSNAVCLRAILFACSVADPPEWDEALELLHSSDIVVESSSSPAHIDPGALCNAMLACSKANEWEESLQLLRLYGSSTNVSIVAINSLIAACGRGGRPDMAMEILNNEIYKYNLQPDLLTYRNAVIACNQAAHHERKMAAVKHGVDTPLQTTELTTDNNDDDDDEDTCDGDLFEWWECAISLLYRMKESGIQPDTHTLSSAISACEAAGEWETALSVLQTIIDSINDTDNEDPAVTALNLYCFNAAISACEKGGAWAEALDIYERMKEYGGKELRPSIVTLGSMILALDKGGQKDLAVTIYEEGIQQNIINPWRITQNSSGRSVKAMDLHRFSAAMARATIRSHMENLLAQGSSNRNKKKTTVGGTTTSSNEQVSDDLIIITGKGLRSEDGRPILMPTVRSLLKEEYDIDATIENINTGRLIVSSTQLKELLQRRSWR